MKPDTEIHRVNALFLKAVRTLPRELFELSDEMISVIKGLSETELNKLTYINQLIIEVKPDIIYTAMNQQKESDHE